MLKRILVEGTPTLLVGVEVVDNIFVGLSDTLGMVTLGDGIETGCTGGLTGGAILLGVHETDGAAFEHVTELFDGNFLHNVKFYGAPEGPRLFIILIHIS